MKEEIEIFKGRDAKDAYRMFRTETKKYHIELSRTEVMSTCIRTCSLTGLTCEDFDCRKCNIPLIEVRRKEEEE